MKKILCSFLFAFLTIVLPLSAGAAEMEKHIIPFQTWQGEHASIDKQTYSIAHDQGQWIKIWSGTENKVSTLPLQKTQMAVGIFTGTKSTFGYRVVIEDVIERPGVIEVLYRLLDPKTTRIAATPYESSPWVIAILPASQKPVLFKQTTPFKVMIAKITRGIGDVFNRLFVSGVYEEGK